MKLVKLRSVLDRTRFQARIWQALRSGPPFRSRLDRIIIDLTHECDLACLDCNRSCGAGQAPMAANISLAQVRRFVEESLAAGKRWRRIMLEGGEPTLHPQLDEILAELLRYRQQGHADCEIELCSNGHGPLSAQALRRLPRGVRLKNSAKSAVPCARAFRLQRRPARPGRVRGRRLRPGLLHPSHLRPGPDAQRLLSPSRLCGHRQGLRLRCRAEGPAGHGRGAGRANAPALPAVRPFREFRSHGGRRPRFWPRGSGRAFPPGSRSPSWERAYRDFRSQPPVLTTY